MMYGRRFYVFNSMYMTYIFIVELFCGLGSKYISCSYFWSEAMFSESVDTLSNSSLLSANNALHAKSSSYSAF